MRVLVIWGIFCSHGGLLVQQSLWEFQDTHLQLFYFLLGFMNHMLHKEKNNLLIRVQNNTAAYFLEGKRKWPPEMNVVLCGGQCKNDITTHPLSSSKPQCIQVRQLDHNILMDFHRPQVLFETQKNFLITILLLFVPAIYLSLLSLTYKYVLLYSSMLGLEIWKLYFPDPFPSWLPLRFN